VAAAAINLVVVVQREFRCAFEFGRRDVIRRHHADAMATIASDPHLARIHHEAIVAGQAHALGAGDVLHAARLLGELLDGDNRVRTTSLEVADLHRVAGLAVELVSHFLGDSRTWH
jgi:hypothetical protein